MSGIILARRPNTFARGIVLPDIGDAFMGGYYAGIIDTTKGNIIAADASQTGLRYALIVSPKSLEATGKKWKSARSAGPAGVRTRWDGLGATVAMIAAGSSYEAAYYCGGLSYGTDDASQWYLPAMDELEIVYRALKCSTENNYTSALSTSGNSFPGAGASLYPGTNPSSDPAGGAYISSVPAQTSVSLFKTGAAQALGAASSNAYYLTSTEYDAADAIFQYPSGTFAGFQTYNYKDATTYVTRPVRRLVLM